MAKIHICTNQGILIETIDTSGYDLSKSIARSALTIELFELVDIADMEKAEESQPAEEKKS